MVDLDLLAREVKDAQDAARQVTPFSARYPGLTLDHAYAVARAVHGARLAAGAKPLGRKIGFTNRVLWDEYGVREPIWGHVYDTTVTWLESDRGTLSLRGLAEPRIEPEIVLHLGSAPRAEDDDGQLLARIDWIAHGFEIVQSHFPGWKFRAPDTVMDGSLHGRLVVGPPFTPRQVAPDPKAALASFALTLACDGAVMDTGRGSDVLGSPLLALRHLIAVLATQPDEPPLRAGELVTTGTITRALPIAPGQTWRTQLEGIDLPGVTLVTA